MATRIETLSQNGDVVLPRTVSSAVTMEDGTSLEYAIHNRDTDDIKLTAPVAEALGVPVGTTVSDLLKNSANTANVIAAAEVVD